MAGNSADQALGADRVTACACTLFPPLANVKRYLLNAAQK